MKEGWEIKKLGEVYDVRDGTHDSPKYLKEGYPLLTSKNLKNDTLNYNQIKFIGEQDYININKRSKVDIGDVLFAMIGTIGNPVVIKDEPDFAIKNVALFKVSKSQNSYFLKYFLDTSFVIKQMAKDAKGTTQKFVGLGYLRNFKIPLPPLPEQQKIVAILDEAFAAISKAKANAEQNLKNAKELFESYLQRVFENKGEGWEDKELGEICTFLNGRAYKKTELLNKGKYRVLRVGNFFTNNHWYYSDLELSDDKFCDHGDLLYAWSASFGPKIWNGEKVIFHYHIWKVVPNSNIISKEFLYILLEWDKEKIKEAQGTGTTMMHVSKGSIEKRKVPLPPLSEQQLIVQKLNALSAETQKLEAIYQKKIDDLEELKKSILQKAFSGELSELGLDRLEDERIKREGVNELLPS